MTLVLVEVGKSIKNVVGKGNNMSGKDLFQKVKELNLPKGKYALFGSAPMGLRGIRECHDIDIIAKKKKNIESINLQVKSRYNEGLPSIFTANIKSTLVNNKKMVNNKTYKIQ